MNEFDLRGYLYNNPLLESEAKLKAAKKKLEKQEAKLDKVDMKDEDAKEKAKHHKDAIKNVKKEIVFEKDYWKVNFSHDGYLKNYNSIHERQIEFYPNKMTFIGIDKIIKKKINRNYKFDIRFHIEPNVKLMKTQDNKTILIELEDEGWMFTCDNYDINIDNGLYFGNKNLYSENQNIFISGISNNLIDNIKWEIKQI